MWDDDRRCWVVDLEQRRRGPGGEDASVRFSVTAQYVVLANGILNHPKAPRIDGLDGFAGHMMHASRWDYDVSGGSPTDPRLTKLRGKKVGVIGTGASGVQCVAALAAWAGGLYVFQRTPPAVDARDQRALGAEEWAKLTGQPGWWSRRNINFVDAVAGEGPEVDLVDDGWTKAPTLSMVAGARHQPLRPEEIPAHIERMLAKDVPRSNRMRQRVVDLVTKDKETVEALKPWYPTWCKRYACACLSSFFLHIGRVTILLTD